MINKEKYSAKGTEDNIDITKQMILRMFNSKNEVTKVKEQENTKPIDELSKKWDMNDKIIELFAENMSKDQKLKERYAIILIIILAIQLIALIVIFILKGCNILNYSDSTFNIFISGGIAEVFILVRVIVKYLFKDNLTNSLNIILENNNRIKYWKNKNNKKNIDKKD